jgi:hypothetical protein
MDDWYYDQQTMRNIILLECVTNNDIECAKKILKLGADPNSTHLYLGVSTIELAVYKKI